MDRIWNAEPDQRYRFGNVVVETRGRRVFVDGRERKVPRRVFDLLLLLCRAPRRVIPRDALYEALWSGGQVVSDEALTQAVFRVRALLGTEGRHLVTLRGVGIRFDADVTVENDEPPVGRDSDVTAKDQAAETDRAPTFEPAAGRPRRFGTAPILLAVAVLALLTWSAWLRWPAAPGQPIDPGYGITLERIHADRTDTPTQLAIAVRYDDAGDRPRARAVLETLHEADRRTPWPALLTGLWDIGTGDPQQAQGWLVEARERIQSLDDPYLNALLRYAEAEHRGAPRDIIRYAGAVLDLEPGAWRLRLARAHLYHYLGQREPALREIRKIQVHALGIRRLESAVADRASFGDVEGAQAQLVALPRNTDRAAWEYLAGRIAWSRGDRQAARQAWERAFAEARSNGRDDIRHRAQVSAGFAAMLGGDISSAMALFEAARVNAEQSMRITDRIDLTLLLAQLHALLGDERLARDEFDLAVGLFADDGGNDRMRTQTVLVGARLFPERQTGLEPIAAPAAQALLDARRALHREDMATARAAWLLAEQHGALGTELADEARLLAAQLALPVAPERPFDPPYAPLSAAVPRLLLARMTGATH
ncbi:MAG: winged helix-turn-helix domain-containing protein [Dokdonella sp.]|nr:winged helix-turn-helix domain-containing protein [Dokdonella sp.]